MHVIFKYIYLFLKETLRIRREQFEEEMKKAYEEQLKEKETSLLQQLNNTKHNLIDERVKVEDRLQDLTKQLQEKDVHLKEELLKQKEQLDQVINQKELKQKMLEKQLEEVKSKKEENNQLQLKEDVLANFTELMETELQCSICSELFVQVMFL